jgi:prepilin-type N-terminal cleavage/methylation domain-containing protein
MFITKPNPIKPVAGFTLIELLVSISITAIIGLTIVSAFSAGLKALSRAQSYSGPQADVLIAFEKIEKDLRNTALWSQSHFTGSGNQISFPAFVNVTDEKGLSETVLGTISYFTDSTGKVFLREEAPYPRVLSGSAADSEVLTAVENMSFLYGSANAETQKTEWKSSWEGEGKPLGVKVTVGFKNVNEHVELSRTILLPS